VPDTLPLRRPRHGRVGPAQGEYAVFMMLIAVFLGGGGKCSIDRRLPKELQGR
jgi:hypothetical protein